MEIKNKMSRYIVPEEMLEDYKHFIDAIINTKPQKTKVSITNSFTTEGRTITFTLEAIENKKDFNEKTKIVKQKARDFNKKTEKVIKDAKRLFNK